MMMIEKWLMLPVAQIVLILAMFFSLTASMLCWISYYPKFRDRIYAFRGVSAAFYGSIVPILGILIGFLSSDVWESNKKAAEIVREEAAELTSIYGLVAVADLPYVEISRGIRNYVSAVVENEWPAMSRGEAAADAEIAQDNLIKIASNVCARQKIEGECNHTFSDIALKVRETRSNRLKLSTDNTETIKWASVLFLALIAQISIASVHLANIRPQIASLAIFTSAIVVVLSLIALHELPFAPPIVVSSAPLADLLKVIPENGS